MFGFDFHIFDFHVFTLEDDFCPKSWIPKAFPD